MKTREEVSNFFHGQLKPTLEPLEAQRIKVARKIVSLGVIMSLILAGLLFVSFFILFQDEESFLPYILFFLTLIAGIVWFSIYRSLLKSYTATFKDSVIKGILQFIDPSFVYIPTSCISFEEYKESGIFQQRVDRYSGDDYVEGKSGRTPFHFSEIHSLYKTESTDSKGRRTTTWHTIFKGLFFRALFSKNFKGRTFVLTDYGKGQHGIIKTFTSFFQKLDKSHGQLVKMDNPVFEEFYAVYGTDSIEVHYILSQTLMERLVSYRQKTGKNVVFSFVNNTVFAAIPYRENLFEPKVFTTLFDDTVILKYYDDMSFALSIVEELNLNVRLWGEVSSVKMN